MAKPSPKDRPRLGRGLASLISVTEPQAEKHPAAPIPEVVEVAAPVSAVVSTPEPAPLPAPAHAPEPVKLAGGKPMDLEIALIAANPGQPRQTFTETALRELADSMKTNGVIQPILVRPMPDGRYQLIAGERRWRAAQMAGLTSIPAIVREVDALAQAELAMIENIQREDLNPIERALGYQVLIKEMGLTQAELATRLGEDRSSIANYLRLLDLCEAARDLVREGKLSAGHAKLLAGVADILEQQKLAQLVVSQGLSVRNLERILQEKTSGAPATPARAALSPHLADVEKTLCRQLGLRVQLRAGAERGKGRIVLHYSSLDQFDEIVDRLGVNLAND